MRFPFWWWRRNEELDEEIQGHLELAARENMEAAACRIVLVGPENPRNVGFAARAMLCFGASELVLVAAPWKTIPPEARKTGVSAPDISVTSRRAVAAETPRREQISPAVTRPRSPRMRRIWRWRSSASTLNP